MKKLLVIGLTIMLLGGLAVLTAGCGSGASTPATTVSATVEAVGLAFTTQPDGAAAGSAFSTQPVVAIVDTAGNTVTGYRGLVELTVTPVDSAGGVPLFGGTKIISEDGVVAFRSLMIKKAGTYTLTATSGTLAPATSESFSIVPGPAEKLAFTAQPSGGTAGSPLTPQPVVIVQDRYGNTVTDYEGSITLSATDTMTADSPYAAMTGQTETQTSPVDIYGTLTVPVVGSEARFTDVWARMSLPGYRLVATSGSLASASSGFFTVFPSDPAQLEITVQPQGAGAGELLDIQPKVAIEDRFGNVVNKSRAEITLSITPDSGTAGATLSGTTTLVAEDALGGLAEFIDLSIDLPGQAYTLTASSSGLPSVISQPFDINEP